MLDNLNHGVAVFGLLGKHEFFLSSGYRIGHHFAVVLTTSRQLHLERPFSTAHHRLGPAILGQPVDVDLS
jgi:hypothetical protein